MKNQHQNIPNSGIILKTFPHLYTMFIYALLAFYLRQKNQFFNILNCFWPSSYACVEPEIGKPAFEYSSFELYHLFL